MGNRYAWSRSSDAEIWYGGPCDSIKECVDEALDEGLELTDSFAIGIIEPYVIDYDFADDLTYRLGEDAFDEVGEVASDWLNYVSKEDLQKLNTRITGVIKEWLKEIHEEPSFYKVLPCKNCTLQQALELHNEKVANMNRGGKIENN